MLPSDNDASQSDEFTLKAPSGGCCGKRGYFYRTPPATDLAPRRLRAPDRPSRFATS
jgi:hypothetical protein